jgi:hypothetical protein
MRPFGHLLSIATLRSYEKSRTSAVQARAGSPFCGVLGALAPPLPDRERWEHTMKISLKRFALVLVLYLAVFEATEQLAVTRSESWGELAQMGLFAVSAAGLIWTIMPAFANRQFRPLCRIGLFLGYVAITVLVTNAYSWHIRPNVGLYQEPLWVAQHPVFQKELQARIERNRW